MPFRDVIEIVAQGGKGGDGGLSFMRLKYIPKGGPDGGHGGDGGSVYLEAVDDVTSLDRLVTRTVYRGGTGAQGEGRNRAGAGGGDVVVHVPVGTIASDLETGEVLADLLVVGERARVAAGGDGGRGNASFANSYRRAPRFAEFGTPGERRRLRLELRTIADVGLVGYPNAGKSSLLAACSNARPKVAAYPFTTLTPQLGVVVRDHRRITIADIPGIIEDAHLGRGLGLDFLRHIARTRLLAFVVDLADDPVGHLAALRRELEAHDPLLLTRPSVLVLNKIDLLGVEDVEAATELFAGEGMPVFALSAAMGDGVEALVSALFELVPRSPALPGPRIGHLPPRVEPLRVTRDDSGLGWVVHGGEVEALVARFDPKNRDAVSYLQRHFLSLGVDKLLARAGATTGDEVRIGAAVFDYFDEASVAAAERASDAEESDEAERRWRDDVAPDADGDPTPDADGDPTPDADGDPTPDADGDPTPDAGSTTVEGGDDGAW